MDDFVGPAKAERLLDTVAWQALDRGYVARRIIGHPARHFQIVFAQQRHAGTLGKIAANLADARGEQALALPQGPERPGVEAGDITSAARSYEPAEMIALAYLRQEASAPGTRVMVTIDGRQHEAVVSDLPFIR